MSGAGDVLPHQADQPVLLARPHRREADSAVARDHGGDAVPTRRLQQAVPADLDRRSAVDVHEAGRDDLPPRRSSRRHRLPAAAPRRRRTSAILPSLMATSASNRSAPVPSTTVPPVILRSNTIYSLELHVNATVVNVTPLQTNDAGSEGPIVTHRSWPATPPTPNRKTRSARRRRPSLVPAERYHSAAFAQLEAERMWPKVWQVACTVDHVAEPGDYFEYRCGHYGASSFETTTPFSRLPERVPPPQLAVLRPDPNYVN